MWTEYDRGVNTFSPEGRFFLVVYAIEAIKTKGVMLAVESVSLRSCWLTCEPTTQALCALPRPFGVSLFSLLFMTETGRACKYYTDPSGTFWKYDANAIGSGSEGADSSARAIQQDLRNQ
ncbi:hypothetical protein MKW98_008242 [Papaver atlanticum]|uniref:Proteasome alpha-type subunits domain-containing protein n=1 Tax=Papaver atlanticum TaxID=357466 RepID=A0AAD4RWM3_9MAGN|nr:hypothetical protein MKW98_008242 [Papaver atlanticum]